MKEDYYHKGFLIATARRVPKVRTKTFHITFGTDLDGVERFIVSEYTGSLNNGHRIKLFESWYTALEECARLNKISTKGKV